MQFIFYFLLVNVAFAQNELAQQFQLDIEEISQQVEKYQESDQASQWQQDYEHKELEKRKVKYRNRKVKGSCGTCPLNSFVQKLTEKRLNELYRTQQIEKSLWSGLQKGMYYFSYDQKKAFSSYHEYKSFINKKVGMYILIDQHKPKSLVKSNKTQNLQIYTYKTHELFIEILYNHSRDAVFRIYQLPEKLLNSPKVILQKYNFQDPQFAVPTELSFQKLVEYNGKFLSFHSDIKVGTGEFLTELDYELKAFAKGELVFSGTNDNTQTTLRHNLKTGSFSKLSLYLKTYYLGRMTPDQRSKTPVYQGDDLRQNYWGLEWQWVFDSN